jgi:hypothetical protein
MPRPRLHRPCPWLPVARDLEALWLDAPPEGLWWAVVVDGRWSCSLHDRTDAGWIAERFRGRERIIEVVADLGDWRNVGILLGTLADHSAFVDAIQSGIMDRVDVAAEVMPGAGMSKGRAAGSGADAWGEAVARAVLTVGHPAS